MFILPFDRGSLDWLKGGLFRQGSTSENSFRDILARYGDFNLREGIDSVYLPRFRGELNDNYVAYSPALYSICKASAHQEEAWAFLRFLLTDEAQSYMSYAKNYTNLVSRERMFDTLRNERTSQYGGKVEEFIQSIEDLQENIDYLYDMDYYVTDLLNPICEYLEGKVSLDEAIARAEQSVWIRINE